MLALIGLILFIVIYTAESNSYLGECPASHRSHNLTNDAKLGSFSSYAIAMDEIECSKVAKSADYIYFFFTFSAAY